MIIKNIIHNVTYYNFDEKGLQNIGDDNLGYFSGTSGAISKTGLRTGIYYKHWQKKVKDPKSNHLLVEYIGKTTFEFETENLEKDFEDLWIFFEGINNKIVQFVKENSYPLNVDETFYSPEVNLLYKNSILKLFIQYDCYK